ncbi:MAG: Cyanophage [Pseudomonadota bacterium]
MTTHTDSLPGMGLGGTPDQPDSPSVGGAEPTDSGVSPKKRRTKKAKPPQSVVCTFAEYQQIPGVNWSSLKHIAKSPLHYKHHKEQPPEDTAAFMGGRLFHSAVLEPDRLPLDYAVWTGARRAGAEWEQFKAAHAGRTIVKTEEYREVLAMRDAIRAHRPASRLLTGGEPERSITWNDPETGLWCKGRIDFLRPDGFVDLKRTANLDERRFGNTAHDLAYHMQFAFYARGLKALGMESPKVWMVAVEGSEPYDVAAFEVDEGAIATGDEKVSELLALLADCEKRKRWPGRYPEETKWFLPGWAYTDSDEDFTSGMGLTIGTTGGAA